MASVYLSHPPCLKRLVEGLLPLLVFVTTLAAGPSAATSLSNGPKERITLQLRWKHQFQFAGYYAAKAKGFYEQEGLEVSFRERVPGKGHVASVLAGEAQYGTDDATLLSKRLNGKPVVLLAQIFQHSPLILVAKQASGIISPFEMIGKTVMYARRDAPINTMFLETLGDLSKIRHVPHSMKDTEFLDGRVDVISAYITDLPYRLRKKGIRFNMINPQSYGIDFYGDNLFTTETEIREHPDRVVKMRRASLKGWAYALGHKDDIIDLILERYAPGADRGALEFEARMTEMMILPDLIELGSFNPRRFDRIAETYARLGITTLGRVPDSFFFKKHPQTGFYLTEKEQAWLADHPKIRIGTMDAWPPLNYVDGKGTPKGIGADYIEELNKRLNHRITMVPARFDANYTMVTDKKLDALMDITQREERTPFFHFTTPYLKIPHVIIGWKNGPHFDCEKDLIGKTVALEKGFYSATYLKKHYPGIRIREYDSTSAALGAVLRKEAEAYVGNRTVAIYLMEQELMTGLQLQGRSEKPPVELSIGIRKDWPELAAILNRALAAITPEEESRIRRKWLAPGAESLTPDQIVLTKDEATYVRNHPKIVLGSSNEFPPYIVVDEKGGITGVCPEFISLINQKTGLDISFEIGLWTQIEKKALNKRLDGVVPLINLPDRAGQFSLSSPLMKESAVIFVKKGNPGEIHAVEDLNHRRMVIQRGGVFMKKLADSLTGIQPVYVDSISEMIATVVSGRADFAFYMQNVFYIAYKEGMYPYIEPAFPLGAPMEIVIGIQKEIPHLLSIINKGIQSISEEEKNRILWKWTPPVAREEKPRDPVDLTLEEKEFLSRKGTIKMSVLPDWLPYERINEDGRHEGIGKDMIRLISERIRTPIELVPTREWGQSLQNLRSKKCDILPIAMDVPSRKAAMAFTRPYIVEPFVIATRSEELFVKDAGDIGNRKIGIVKDYAFTEVFKLKYPNIQIVDVVNAKDGLERVQRHELFGYIDSMPTIAFTLQKYSMLDLKIAGRMEFNLELSIACRRDEPLLLSIMQKAADAITEEERRKIIGKWLSIRFDQGFDYGLMWKILAGVGGLLFVILFWNRHLSDMNRKIRQANQEARAANQAKSRFLANMSHEIRTPLNAVTGFSELLSSLVTDEKQKSYLKAIKSSGKSLMLLINDILDLSKIEAGKMDIHYGSVDLRAVLREIEQIFALQVAGKGIRFITEIDQHLPPALSMDEIRLRQVLLNIVGNAVKFTDSGHIRLSVSVHGPKEDTDKKDTHTVDVHFLVEDTGIGIRETEKDHIFDSFQQQSHQDSSLYGGTGLGLAISKRLVEMMNGRIDVGSIEGKGSRFSIIIRDVVREDKKPMKAGEIPHLKATRFQRKRVLVVDDVESNRLFLKELLEKANLEVLEAQNGHEAVIITPEYRPDLILMDIRMPVMNGFESAVLLRDDPRSARIPIIAVTASSSTLKASSVLEKGFSGFISKPIDIGELMSELLRYFPSLPKNTGTGREETNPKAIGISIPAADMKKLLSALDPGFTEKWRFFNTRQPIREVRAFAAAVSELGRKHHANIIEEYGERLLSCANNFDVEKMTETLAEFPELVEGLRELAADREGKNG